MGTELNLTLGALLIGVLVTAVGYGVTTTQTYMYTNRYPNDPRFIRWTVWTLLVLDTAHIILTWHMIYYYLILNFDNKPALQSSVWSFNITIVITATITVIVHCFYARRIFILGGRNWYLVSFILILSSLRLIFGCIECVKIFHLELFSLIKTQTIASVIVGLGAGTLADCVITASLVYLLRSHKSGLNPRLDSMLDKVTYWTVNNGMLTSIVGIAFLVTQFSPIPPNMIFLALHLLLSKLYANSLLATLNFRETPRGRGRHTDDNDAFIHMSNILRTNTTAGSTAIAHSSTDDKQSTPASSAPVVHIVTTATTDAVSSVDDIRKDASLAV